MITRKDIVGQMKNNRFFGLMCEGITMKDGKVICGYLLESDGRAFIAENPIRLKSLHLTTSEAFSGFIEVDPNTVCMTALKGCCCV